MMDWRETVVIITGASDGIGASCARLLTERGAKLSLAGLASPTFDDDLSDNRTLVTTGDLTSAENRQRLVHQTLRRFGRIDILINNAAVGQYGWPSEVDTEVSKRVFDLNVFAALALIQLVIPTMRHQRSGRIVNMGSIGGKVSLPWAVMYCATKWALHCIDDSLRRELSGSGITVTKVCPGIVDTKFREHVLAGEAPQAIKAIRRVVTPDQVALSVLRAVERKRRVVYVPRLGRLFAMLDTMAPWLMDTYLSTKA